MKTRAAIAFVALLIFYEVVPLYFGGLPTSVFFSALIFSIATFSVGHRLLGRNPAHATPLSHRWWVTLKGMFWIAHIVLLIATLTILFEHGSSLFGASRDDLFRIRESALNSLTVISINVGLATAGVLATRSPRYIYGFLLPVGFEVLTQSRGFILSAMLVLFVCGSVSRKMLLGAAIGMFGVTAIRISEPLNFGTLVEYVAGEALNTAMGNSLLPEGAYSVNLLQATRVLLAPFPFVGNLLDVQSEAVVFNDIIQAMFGQYGLAFGILGFAKFTSFPVMTASLAAATFAIFLLLRCRMPPTLLLVILVAALPTYFRWSPAEFFFVVARVSFVMLAVHHLRLIFTARRPIHA